jgi:hypothetical protein
MQNIFWGAEQNFRIINKDLLSITGCFSIETHTTARKMNTDARQRKAILQRLTSKVQVYHLRPTFRKQLETKRELVHLTP